MVILLRRNSDDVIVTAIRVRATVDIVLEAVVAGGASVIVNAVRVDRTSLLSLMHQYTVNYPEHYHLGEGPEGVAN